jgi:hypothetical protein
MSTKRLNPALNRTAALDLGPDSDGSVGRCRLVWCYAEMRILET